LWLYCTNYIMCCLLCVYTTQTVDHVPMRNKSGEYYSRLTRTNAHLIVISYSDYYWWGFYSDELTKIMWLYFIILTLVQVQWGYMLLCTRLLSFYISNIIVHIIFTWYFNCLIEISSCWSIQVIFKIQTSY